MHALRTALAEIRDFLGIPSSSGSKLFKVMPLTPEEEVKQQEQLKLIREISKGISLDKPVRSAFSTTFMYLQAQAAYTLAMSAKKSEQVAGVTLVSESGEKL
jgi:hypothetical protein